MNRTALVAALAACTAVTLAAPAALAGPHAWGWSGAACCGVYHPGTAALRDRLLATPRPYPPNRVDSPSRLENGRVWIPGERYGSRAARVYGADPYDHAPVIYTRRDHQIIAIDPWCSPRGDSRLGFNDLELARNQWLREQGYVLGVRTHVNPRYLSDEAEMQYAELPAPRATIKRHIEVREKQSPVAHYTGAVSTHEIRERIAAESDAGEPVAEADE